MTNLTQTEWNNCLEKSIKKDNLEGIVEALDNGANTLDAGAFINSTGGIQVDMFFLALEKCSLETIKYLIKRGVNLNCNNLNRSYLTTVIRKGACRHWFTKKKDKTDTKSYKLCELLLQNGSPVNFTSTFGVSELMTAVGVGYCEVVKLLYKLGLSL